MATKSAVDILKEIGVPELYLGNTKFSGRNKNVIMGDQLAEKLLKSLNRDARNIIAESVYISDIIEKYEKIKKQI